VKSLLIFVAKLAKRVLNLGSKGASVWGPSWLLSAFVIGCLVYLMVLPPPPVAYAAPRFWFGIAKVRGDHRYKLICLGSGCIRREIEARLPYDSDEKWYAGQVLSSWVYVYDHDGYQQTKKRYPNDDLGYTIVRDNKEDAQWHQMYGYLTRDDGPGRAVLALNCHNNAPPPKDTDTVCEGGEANFTEEKTDARSSGSSTWSTTVERKR